MSSIGDLISQLSTSTPLNSGATWTSDPYIPGQYNSLMTTAKSDVNFKIEFEWSPDCIDWDYNVTSYVEKDVGSSIATVVSNKWCRMKVTCTDPNNMFYLRVSTYGVVTNNTSIVIIGKDIFGSFPVVMVGNLNDNASGVPTTQLNLRDNYHFLNFSGTTITTLVSPYPELYHISHSAAAVTFNQKADGLGLTLDNPAAGAFVTLGSRNFYPLTAGTQYVFNFAASYSTNPDVSSFVGFGHSEDSTIALGGLAPKWAMGFGTHAGKISIIIYKDSTRVVIPQEDWNNDKFDGSFVVKRILDPTEIVGYRILYDPSGVTLFSVQAQWGMYWICNVELSVPGISGDNVGFMAYHESIAGNAVTTETTVRSFDFNTYGNPPPLSKESWYLESTGLTLNTNLRFFFRVPSTGTHRPRRYIIKGFTISNYEAANTNPKFNINCRVGRVYGLAGASWNTTNNIYSDLEYSTAGTINATNDLETTLMQCNTIDSKDCCIELYTDATYYVNYFSNNCPAGAGLGGTMNIAFCLEFI